MNVLYVLQKYTVAHHRFFLVMYFVQLFVLALANKRIRRVRSAEPNIQEQKSPALGVVQMWQEAVLHTQKKEDLIKPIKEKS